MADLDGLKVAKDYHVDTPFANNQGFYVKGARGRKRMHKRQHRGRTAPLCVPLRYVLSTGSAVFGGRVGGNRMRVEVGQIVMHNCQHLTGLKTNVCKV